MHLRDIGRSLYQELGKTGPTDSAAEHLLVLGKIAFGEFIRSGRGVPMGLFEEAGLRFSPRMINILRDSDDVLNVVPIGDVPGDMIEMVSRIGWEVLGLPIRIRRRRAVNPSSYDAVTRCGDAFRFLHDLEDLELYGRVIGVTDVKIDAVFEEPSGMGRKQVHGYSYVGRPIGVVSTWAFGFREDRISHIPWARLLKVVVHELAHGFGAIHHPEDRVPCVMSIGPDIDGKTGLDNLPHELCSQCLGTVLTKSTPPTAGLKVEQ